MNESGTDQFFVSPEAPQLCLGRQHQIKHRKFHSNTLFRNITSRISNKLVQAMSSENKETTEDELASWKRERERRKKERQKQRQQDGAGNEDDFALLAQGMDELNENAK